MGWAARANPRAREGKDKPVKFYSLGGIQRRQREALDDRPLKDIVLNAWGKVVPTKPKARRK